MENYSDLNISTLVTEYRETGLAAEGFKNLMELYSPVPDAKNDELRVLLRHHREGIVYGDELEKRFEIDALIEFYSLIEVAIIAGYVDAKLTSDLKMEAITVLDQKWVRKYYAENYPCFLPSLLRYSLKMDIPSGATNVNLSKKLFNSFLLTNRLIQNDKNVEYFLKMLDDVSFSIHSENYKGSDFEREGLDDLKILLADPARLSDTLSKTTPKSPTDRALWGFIRYADFLTVLKGLLTEAADVPLLQSALWEYHSYWFRLLSNEMKEFFDIALNNLADAVKMIPEPDFFMEAVEEQDDSAGQFGHFQEEMIFSLGNARSTVEYLLNNNFSMEIQNRLLDLQAHYGIEDAMGKNQQVQVGKFVKPAVKKEDDNNKDNPGTSLTS